MDLENKTIVQIQTTIQAPIDAVWEKWTNPDAIVQWNTASEDWHTTKAENDLRVGGKFSSRMEAKDGSMGFDFGGVYDEVQINKTIASTLGDGRKVKVIFNAKGNETEVIETFEAESENPVDFQRDGWQAILDNFKKYVEGNF
ncbi:MAG TPA: SRPBCC family protein [Flavobacterium sp.]|nr:SRPBCC family protein [Flavobacterium sp.]